MTLTCILALEDQQKIGKNTKRFKERTFKKKQQMEAKLARQILKLKLGEA